MSFSKKRSNTITATLLTCSGLAWVLLLGNPSDALLLKHCGSANSSLLLVSKVSTFSEQLMGWSIMVVAMMLPKLILPIEQICKQTFKRQRVLRSLWFALGYLSTWMLAGIFMVTAIVKIKQYFTLSYFPAGVVFLLAVIWECSPIKQRFLNYGHNHRVLAAFGWKANRDSFFFGTTHGMWCVGSGWALMLFPMLLPQGHNLAMALVTLIMISEHLEHPRIPAWRVIFRLKLIRVVIAQIRIKLLPRFQNSIKSKKRRIDKQLVAQLGRS